MGGIMKARTKRKIDSIIGLLMKAAKGLEELEGSSDFQAQHEEGGPANLDDFNSQIDEMIENLSAMKE